MLSLSQLFIDYGEAQASDARGNALGNARRRVVMRKAVNGERTITSNSGRHI